MDDKLFEELESNLQEGCQGCERLVSAQVRLRSCYASRNPGH